MATPDENLARMRLGRRETYDWAEACRHPRLAQHVQDLATFREAIMAAAELLADNLLLTDNEAIAAIQDVNQASARTSESFVRLAIAKRRDDRDGRVPCRKCKGDFTVGPGCPFCRGTGWIGDAT